MRRRLGEQRRRLDGGDRDHRHGATDTSATDTSGTDTSSSTDTTDDDGDASLADCTELTELSAKFSAGARSGHERQRRA